jgi:hypothetical protein
LVSHNYGRTQIEGEENVLSKRDEVTLECRKLHTEELSVLYFSPDIIMMME